ncbi:hypothetical protein HMPREF0995_04760 [Lachnospiraceae bacterium 7_1_58FAA]|nr:hypothetical protein HMPREF0995_04760 [Lachnospiraceae bacterium 7_1_58FAA]MBS5659553.1 zinc ribbon domain-containing protein [Oscillibacter sp.]MBS6235291.1 zinc ribbon domain-containing protein [Clostridiales bacterium]
MLRCPNCKKQMCDTAFFCSECGTRLRELPPEIAALVPPESQRHIPVPVVVKGDSSEKQIPVSELPFDFHTVENQYGTIHFAETICPGVYYIGTKGNKISPHFLTEYIAVTEDSPAISSEARAYGVQLPIIPRVYLYDNDYDCKGRHVVEYEAHKYLAEHGLPLPKGYSLESDKSFGMEVCPEYFGEFPIPEETPWGPVLRHDRLFNGLYWLETAEVGWILAIAYPLCSGIWPETLELASLNKYDQENGIDNTCGYRFFTYKVSCLPIYEMIDYDGNSWGPRINRAALENAVLKFFPNYGSGDGEHSPQFDAGDQIQSTPGAGIDFYNFLAKSKMP